MSKLLEIKKFSDEHFIKLFKENNDYTIHINYNGPNIFISKQSPWIHQYKNCTLTEAMELFSYYFSIELDRHKEDIEDLKDARSSGYATVFRDRSNDKDPNTCGIWISRND